MYQLLTIVVALCLPLGSWAQTLHYDALRKDKVIGGMDIKVSYSGDDQIYEIHSHMEFKVLLVSLKVEFENHEIFHNHVLQSGTVNNKMIGFKESGARIEKADSNYKLWINGTAEPIRENEITYSVSNIYTQEPTHGQKVFSQYYGQYFTFEKVEEHVYKYTSSEGDNYYTYLNGICTDVKVERDFATIYFRLQPESLSAVKNNTTQFSKR